MKQPIRFRRGKFLAIASVVCGIGIGAGAPAASAAQTTVSLTFKDTLISQYSVRQVLADNDVHGTFYVNSGLVANRAIEIVERMSWKQINDLALDGNEIGGGTRSRLPLDLASAAELTAEICDDRNELIRRGYAPVSFGYPRNPDDATAAAQAKVQECGYASARGAGGIGGAGNPVAETIPPQNPFNFRGRTINETHALATIKSWVTAAESTGGWLPLIIHSVCNDPGCSITPANFQELVEWLKAREVTNDTHIRTVRDVMTNTEQPQPPDPLNTTISLAFDDGLDEAFSIAAPEMTESGPGIRGTFFVNSGRIGTDPRFMTWSQVRNVNSQGNEIAGHTTNDANLAGVSAATLNSEVCSDRLSIFNNLNDTVPDSDENAPVSFAYPFGAFDAAAKAKVASVTSTCPGAGGGDLFVGDTGYLSGRAVQGLKWYTRTNRCQLLSCKFDEAIHPADPYELKVIGSVGTDDTLDELKQTVENVYNSGGGWATLVFHEICPGPGVPATPSGSGCPEEDSSTSPEVFEGLTDWLADTAQTSRGINVKTIEQVMEGAAQPRPPVDDDNPVTAISCDGGPCGAVFNSNGSVTVALSGSDAGSPLSSGVKEIRYSTTGVPTKFSPVYTGPFQVPSSATVRFRASDNQGNVEVLKLQPIVVDQTAPTSSIQCNGAACNTHYPAGTVDVTLSAVDPGGTGVENIHYTTDGSEPTTGSPTFTGSPIPVSVTTEIRFRAVDNVGNLETPAKSQTIRIDGAQPESSVLCNGAACSSGFYNSTVSATLSATDFPAGLDASGVKNIRFTTDGSDPTGTSTIYSGAIPVNNTTTLKFRAEDNVGNVESPVESQLIKIDTTPAVSTITCDGAPCSPGGYDHVVRMELQATSPPGTAQPTEIRYTTDGSEPNGSSTLYTGEFFISETSTVKFFSLDEAGNVESPIKSQLVLIDTTAPTSSIHCNGPATNCQDAYNSPIQIHLSGDDGPNGGGVDEIRYTTDGSAPTASSTLYTAPFNVSGNGSHTIRWFATDNAGNAETPNSRTLLIETTPPTSALQCNGSSCNAGFYNAPVTATLSASDGGSGVKNIRFTTNGDDVDGSSQIYLGPFMINGVATIKWRAEDNAGNLETQNSQLVNVDTQAPTTTITCDTDGPGGNPPATCLTAYPNGIDAVLDAVDAGDSGVDEIRYTTNGSDPTGSSTLYTGPIDVDSTTLLKWRASDNAGNVESPIKSRNIIIDTADPTVTTTCNGVACIAPAFNNGTVSLALNGADTGGSGLNDVRYTTDGSAPTASSTLYTGPIVLAATTTVRWRVTDNVGRVATGTQQVNIDSVHPTSTIQCNAAACAGPYTGPVTVALNGSDTGGSGLNDVRYTTDGSAPNASSTLYTAPFVLNSSATVRWRVADNAGNLETPSKSQTVTIDADGPDTALRCNGAACSAGGYNAVVRTSFNVNTDAPPTQTFYTTDGSTPTESSTEWDGDDFFLSETTTVKFFSIDDNDISEPVRTETVVIDTDEPTSSIECNGVACQDFYNAAVSVSLEGDDEGGIAEIRYTADGSAPTASSTLYAGPFNVSGNGSHTIRWFAKDNAGNVETPSNTETFTIENQEPTTTATCNGGACGGFFNQDVNVALTANDAGPAGVKEIRYTTDGTAPNSSSALYAGPIPVTSTTLVRFRAEDNAGNVEALKSVNVQIDRDQPNSTIECNGNPCVGGSSFYNGTVSVELAATDSGDSGVNVIRYTTDGTNPTGSSPVYNGAFNVTETSTIKFRAEDNAGNVESPVNTQDIAIENGPPVTSIQCNGAACQDAYNASVAATLSATDDASGVEEIRYTTDGSEPNGSSNLYTGPIPVNATTTIKFFASDNAGNSESTKSQTIIIDATAPTSSILCDGAACTPGLKDEVVAVTLSGNDTGGAGVKEIRYTTDGSAPTASSQFYNGPIQVASTTTIRYRAEDNAGNVESPANSELVEVDAIAPTTQALCNGAACQASYTAGPITVGLTANDGSGTGVKEIRYTTDGSTPNASSPLYSGPISVSSNTTINFRAEDNIGNVETPKSQSITFKANSGAKCVKKAKKKKKKKKCKKKKKKKKK